MGNFSVNCRAGAQLFEDNPVSNATFDKKSGMWTVTIEKTEKTYQVIVLIFVRLLYLSTCPIIQRWTDSVSGIEISALILHVRQIFSILMTGLAFKNA